MRELTKEEIAYANQYRERALEGMGTYFDGVSAALNYVESKRCVCAGPPQVNHQEYCRWAGFKFCPQCGESVEEKRT